MKTRSSSGSFASALKDRAKSSARRAVSRGSLEAKLAGGRAAVVTEQPASSSFFGFNVKLLEAQTSGKSQKPWDLKPGILARAKKFAKDGTPYADVPISVGHHYETRAVVRWRRVSARSAPGAWFHPGFAGSPDLPPGLDPDFLSIKPGDAIKPTSSPSSAAGREPSWLKRVAKRLRGLFVKGMSE